MKILIAPLNWGLGHASRCLPLIVRHLRAGDEVVLAGDGESLLLLRRHFPGLRYYPLAPLQLRYSAGTSQVGAVMRMLPKLFIWAKGDHQALEWIVQHEAFDCIISDNRPGLYLHAEKAPKTVLSSHTENAPQTVYITHQIRIPLPRGWRFLEPILQRLHRRIIHRFSECWIPDYQYFPGLAGRLSHTPPLPRNARYIGPLSRFEYLEQNDRVSSSSSVSVSDSHSGRVSVSDSATCFDAVAVLSGLEPLRSLLEKALIAEYKSKAESLLLIQGRMGQPQMEMHLSNGSPKGITILPTIDDDELIHYLRHAHTIIARSGYSTIMDLHALGLLHSSSSSDSVSDGDSDSSSVSDSVSNKSVQLRLIPTPGQPEQEELALLHS